MLFKKNSKSSHAFVANQLSLRNTPVWADLWRLFWFACAFFTMIALATYSPTDSSWSTWSSSTQFHNWMGRSGSIISDLLFQLFGITSFALIILMLRIAKKMQQYDENGLSRFWNFSAVFLFLFSLSALIQGSVSRSWLPWRLNNTGGITGQFTLATWRWAAGPIGGFLITLFLTFASAILLFRWQAVTQSIELFLSLHKKVKEQGPSLLQTFFTKLKEKIASFKKKTPAAEIPLEIPGLNQEPQITAPAPVAPPIEKPAPVRTPVSTPADVLPKEPVIATLSNDDDEEIQSLLSPGSSGPSKGKTPTISENKARRKSNGPFQLPPLAMLSGRAESKSKPVDKSWYLDKANILVEKLKDFGVEGEVVHISPGPVITVYEFKPASGVKIKDIANLSDDLTLALSVLSVRIVAPIPGKPVVGIEIPSPHREMVFFKDLVQETPFFNDDIRIPIALGRLASGEPVAADLASMPHLLVAGATGTGKSVFINTLISSLLFRFTPQQLKLILVDPKMVELSLYEGIPHLLLPVVVDSKKAAMALRWAVDEMERRYTLMHQAGVRHIDLYNAKLGELKSQGQVDPEAVSIPYIVIVIDEYADLMAVVPKDVELSIARLAQKARASGIHLVLATQRPSTDVVTGTIKANFPSRLSFRVSSSVDAKTILDRTGSERLLGHGDMLFHSAGFTSLKRMQGSFLSDADVARIVDFLKSQGEPEYDERILAASEEGNLELPLGENGDDAGRLYDQALRLVTEKGEASVSLIQRHLRIGYNRAAMLMEELEKEGIVSPSTGTSKRRSVLVNSI